MHDRNTKADRTAGRAALAALLAVCLPAPVRAQAPDASGREVLVVAPAERPGPVEVSSDPAAAPASVTVITKPELDRKPIATYGDVFRDVPGMSVTEYHQGLVAYGISMRGFGIADHGRDVAVFLDGVPLNVSGSQHTNGYVDLAQLIPELLNRVEVVRGPFSVLAGNHAVAGSVQLTTDAAPRSGIKASVDSFGRVRLLPIGSVRAGGGNLLAALDLTRGPGYSRQSDVERANLFARWTRPVGDGELALRVQLYGARADAPGYLDRGRLESGAIDRRDFLSKGIGDAKTQRNVVLNWRSNDDEGRSGWASGWFGVAYFNQDLRRRWTNFDLSTPIGSAVPLNQERDRLNQSGVDVRKTTSFDTAGLPSQLVAGVQFNRERIDARRFLTDAERRPLAPSIDEPDVVGVHRQVNTDTQALYAQYQLQPLARLKLTAGLRWDRLAFDTRLDPRDDVHAAAIEAGNPTAVRASASQASPKLGAALLVVDAARSTVDVFANAARGLKGPYAFADYYGNVGLANAGPPSLAISTLRSVELGVRGAARDGAWRWRVAAWNTRQEREADRNAAGFLQSFRATDRDGFDLEGEARLAGATRVFASFSRVTARIRDPQTEGAVFVPNVPESLFTIGATGSGRFGGHRLDWWLADSLVGSQPITTDGTVRTRSYHRYSARVAYANDAWRGANAFLAVTGYSRQLDELVFDFGGGLLGTPVSPKIRLMAGVQIPL